MPCLLNFIDIENQMGQVDIITRISEIFGGVVAKLKEVNMHLKYKKELITYYLQLCDSKEEQLRYQAVYNLPCMNFVYKSVAKEMQIDFQELYLRFSDDTDFKIK